MIHLQRLFRHLLAALLLSMHAAPAHAGTTLAVVAPLLALSGLAAGLVTGAVAGWKGLPARSFWPGFGIYLGLLALAASTRAGTLDVVPLALVFAAAGGIVPFASAWFALRAGMAALRRRWKTPVR